MAVKDGIEMPDKFEMSRMQEIKISVVTVCLNTANTIKETVNSVLEQSYGNLEYVIVDGMSTDGTLEIIREYERSFGVKVISDKDSGLYNAMNKGIDLCSGDYILFLNSGDILADKHVVENAAAQICGLCSPGKTSIIMPHRYAAAWQIRQTKAVCCRILSTET